MFAERLVIHKVGGDVVWLYHLENNAESMELKRQPDNIVNLIDLAGVELNEISFSAEKLDILKVRILDQIYEIDMKTDGITNQYQYPSKGEHQTKSIFRHGLKYVQYLERLQDFIHVNAKAGNKVLLPEFNIYHVAGTKHCASLPH